MNDRFIAGSAAGITGALIQVLYGYTVKSLGLADRSFHDFGKVFIMSTHSTGALADFVGIVSLLSNGAIFGIVFAYIISMTSSKFYLLKGVIYGTILWHLFLGIGTMHKMPAIGQIPADSSIATLIGSIIYGIVTSYLLRILDSKTPLI